MKIGKNIITLRWGDIRIWKHKSFEYQFEGPRFMNDDLFEFKLFWNRKRDHAGINFIFGIWKLFWLSLNIHDHRHWNENTNSWQTHDDYMKS